MAKKYNSKKPDLVQSSKSRFALVMAPSSNDAPIAYSEDTWDVVNGDSKLAALLGAGGQYDQHTINEALATEGGGGSVNVEYVYDETKSVFDKVKDSNNQDVDVTKGLKTEDGFLKIPVYYYYKFDNNGGTTNQSFVSINLDGKKIGNCPIVQVVRKVPRYNNGQLIGNEYKVVYCDFFLDIEQKTLLISWNNKDIVVDDENPMYITIIG